MYFSVMSSPRKETLCSTVNLSGYRTLQRNTTHNSLEPQYFENSGVNLFVHHRFCDSSEIVCATKLLIFKVCPALRRCSSPYEYENSRLHLFVPFSF